MIPFAWKRSVVVLLLFFFVMTLAPQPAEACGPHFTDAIFVFQKHPDDPLEKFARGNIGVLQPTYARSYLVAAYRNLIDRKSTRLNSSHSQISYAVFCLKKKKQ